MRRLTAADMGCEYYVIDAGWYASGEWWDSIGEWQQCRERFPGGIEEVTKYIRDKGMIPGLWLELEVMGINCEKAKNVPDDWFFVRHGLRTDYAMLSRYSIQSTSDQEDYRNYDTIAANASAGGRKALVTFLCNL